MFIDWVAEVIIKSLTGTMSVGRRQSASGGTHSLTIRSECGDSFKQSLIYFETSEARALGRMYLLALPVILTESPLALKLPKKQKPFLKMEKA